MRPSKGDGTSPAVCAVEEIDLVAGCWAEPQSFSLSIFYEIIIKISTRSSPSLKPCGSKSTRWPPLYRTEHIIKQLMASKVGEVIVADMKAVMSFSGDFHRVKVNLPAARPLVRKGAKALSFK